jgi:hypothetical protein
MAKLNQASQLFQTDDSGKCFRQCPYGSKVAENDEILKKNSYDQTGIRTPEH